LSAARPQARKPTLLRPPELCLADILYIEDDVCGLTDVAKYSTYLRLDSPIRRDALADYRRPLTQLVGEAPDRLDHMKAELERRSRAGTASSTHHHSSLRSLDR
jgi:hypothetical protein